MSLEIGFDGEVYAEYEGASANRVLADIDRYFNEGIKPQSDISFAISGDAPSEPLAAPGNRRIAETFIQAGRAMGIPISTDKAEGQAVLDEINRSGGRNDGARNYVIFSESDMRITDKVRLFRSRDGKTAYGYIMKGKVYIDPDYIAAHPETPLHEIQHVFTDEFRRRNPKRWKALVQSMRKNLPELWEDVRRRYGFREEQADEIADEVLSHFSGSRGTERMREAMREAGEDGDILRSAAKRTILKRIKDWLREVWNWVAERLHLPMSVRPEDIADMTLRDLAKATRLQARGRHAEGDLGETRAMFAESREDVNTAKAEKEYEITIPLEEKKKQIKTFQHKYGGAKIHSVTLSGGIKELMSQPFWEEGWTEQDAKDFLEWIYDGERKDYVATVLDDSGEIVIFADKDFGKYSVENTLFHENIHSQLRNCPRDVDGNNICDRYWNTVSQLPESRKLLESIKGAYNENTWHEEFFTFRLARAMEDGDFSKIQPYLNVEDSAFLDNILKNLNYDQNKEIESRRGRRNNPTSNNENRPQRLDESPRRDEAAGKGTSDISGVGETPEKGEQNDLTSPIRFALADNETPSENPESPESPESPENPSRTSDRQPGGPRFLNSILDIARENVERARQAREQARQARQAQRGKRDQAVRDMFGRGGIMNDESIPPAARQHLAADIVKGLGDIRDVLKSNTLQTEEKVKAITETLIPLMGGMSGVRRYDAERILRGINRSMDRQDVEREVWKAVDIVLRQYERDAAARISKLLGTKATRLDPNKHVLKQGSVDIHAQRSLKELNGIIDGKTQLNPEDLADMERRYLDVIDDPNANEVAKADAEDRLAGVRLAQRFYPH